MKAKHLIELSLAAATLMLAACQAAQPAAISPVAQTITVKGSDFAFEGPAEAQSGWVTVNFSNVGQEAHHAQFAKLNDSVTPQQIQDALKKSEQEALALVTLVGGPSVIDPNGNGSVTMNLTPGQYMLLCFLPSADGVPHLAKGMVSMLTVKGSGPSTAAEPKADVTINAADFHYTMPAEVKAGKQVWKFTNDGPQPHEIVIMKLDEGKTPDDVFAFFAKPEGKPPFVDLGGMQGVSKGAAPAFINLDLQAGNYIAICNIPDSQTGKSHAELGMVMPFTVK
jgi:hypothetical protein